MDVDANKDQIKLVIKKPGLEDTGEYVFNIEVQGMSEEDTIEKNVSLVLRYHQPPQLNLIVEGEGPRGEGQRLRVLNEAYNLSCEAKGFPLDTATSEWTFKSCSSYSNCSSPRKLQPDSLDPTSEIHGLPILNGDYHWKYTSRLNVIANESGVFTCRMCTADSDAPVHLSKQCNESSVNFFVTDFSTGFDVDAAVVEGRNRRRPAEVQSSNDSSASNAEVIEKDNVELTCAASVYDFANVEWYKNVDGYLDVIKSRRLVRKGPKVQNYKSDFSIISKVIFREIEESDEGTYECRVTPRSASYSGSRNKTFEFTVLEMIAPEKGSFFNLVNSEAVFDTGDSLDLNCTVNPDARPTPTITWTKDGNSSTLLDDPSIQWLNGGQRMRIKYLVHVHSGFYQCQVESRAGSFVSDLNVIVREDSTVSTGLIAGVVVGVIVLIIISGVLLWKVKIYNRKFKELTQAELMLFETGDPSSINPELGLEDQADLLPYEKEYEFDRSKLKLGRQLGAGAFGRVLKAQGLNQCCHESH